jgi:hypothetical protein
MGRAEHASIASFSRFCLDLVSLGAPPSLLLDTQRAIADEIEHARLCFGLASAYDGRAIGPSALPAACMATAMRDAATIVAETIAEGCVAETIAAAQAAVAATRARDPEVAVLVGKIADDEQRHAALAWSFVRWMAQTRPELSACIAAAFTRAMRLDDATPPLDEVDDGAHGIPSTRERSAIARRTLATVVLPAAAAIRDATRATSDDGERPSVHAAVRDRVRTRARPDHHPAIATVTATTSSSHGAGARHQGDRTSSTTVGAFAQRSPSIDT